MSAVGSRHEAEGFEIIRHIVNFLQDVSVLVFKIMYNSGLFKSLLLKYSDINKLFLVFSELQGPDVYLLSMTVCWFILMDYIAYYPHGIMMSISLRDKFIMEQDLLGILP